MAPAVAAKVNPTRRWLLDTGCPYDLTSRKSLFPCELNKLRPSDVPVELETANGVLKVDTSAHVQVGGVCENITPYVLEETPDVLSVGYRCTEKGYGFYWEPYQQCPTFVSPDGNEIPVDNDGYCPYMVEDVRDLIKMNLSDQLAPAMPASSSGEIAVGVAGDGSHAEPNALAEGAAPQEADTDEDDGQETVKDHAFTHRVFNPQCRACVRGRAQRTPRRRGALALGEKPLKFGQQCTGDHIISRKTAEDPSLPADEYDGVRTAVAMYDRATGWYGCYPKASKSAEHTLEAFRHWQGPSEKILSFYADNAPELRQAAREMRWRMPTSTPGVPQTNGLAERSVRTLKEGITTNLAASGLVKRWWEYAGPHHAFARNIQHVAGDSSYMKRHGEHCKAKQIPFGALVDFMPRQTEVQQAFEAKTRSGLMVGYEVHPGGKWSGDYLIAELDVFRKSPDSRPSDVKIHRTKEVFLREGAFVFPVADYRCKMEDAVGGGHDVPQAEAPDLVFELPVEGDLSVPPQDVVQAVPVATPVEGDLSVPLQAAVQAEPVAMPDEGEPSESVVMPPPRAASDVRGMGEADVSGRPIRKYAGSSRPPGIDPMAWSRLYSRKEKKEAIAEYLSSLEPPGGAGASSAAAPALPCVLAETPHREKVAVESKVMSALVARKVPIKEAMANAKARAALDKEYKKLEDVAWPDGTGRGCWDYKRVSSARVVREDARRKGETVHFGRIVELCFEKGSELPEGDSERKFKGRDVFLGDQVRDQNHNWAIFDELGSSPPSMEASRVLDAFAMTKGYCSSSSDAVSAYTQAFLKGCATWVVLPRERWPSEWSELGYSDPVVPLVLALYGHPDAGGFWEERCEEQLKLEGWETISSWPGLYWNSKYKALLIVYVDDFKMAAPEKSQKSCGEG